MNEGNGVVEGEESNKRFVSSGVVQACCKTEWASELDRNTLSNSSRIDVLQNKK